MGIVRRVRSMTRAVGVLGGVDEPENGSTRRGHGEPNGETMKLRFSGETLIIRLRILGDDCRGLSNDGGQCRKPREGQLEHVKLGDSDLASFQALRQLHIHLHFHPTLISSLIPFSFSFGNEMKSAIILYTFALFAATSLALKLPARKTSRHSLWKRSGSASISSSYNPHFFASYPNALPDDADLRWVLICLRECIVHSLALSSVNDMIYVANVRSVLS
jgi:hypothetical protein